MRTFVSTVLTIALLGAGFSASAAPVTPKHGRVLTVNQTAFVNPGTNTTKNISTVAGITVPMRTQDLVLQTVGASVVADGANLPAVPRVDYDDLWTKLAFLQGEEDLKRATWEANLGGGMWWWGCFHFGSWGCRNSSTDWRTLVNQDYASNPAYQVAVYVRGRKGAGVLGDAAQGWRVGDPVESDQSAVVATYAQISVSPQAVALQTAVIDMLKTKNLETAWIDIEHEVLVQGQLKRVSGSMTLNRTDTAGAPGTFAGARIVDAPGSGNTPAPARDNHLDVVYYSAAQYPDFAAGANGAAVMATNGDGSVGAMTWKLYDKTGTQTGSGTINVYGAYDNPFASDGSINIRSGDGSTAGIQCLIDKGSMVQLDSGGVTPCPISSYKDVKGLMLLKSAATATVSYYTRWELDHAVDTSGNAVSDPVDMATLAMTERSFAYNVCKPVQYTSRATVGYKVHRDKIVFGAVLDAWNVTSAQSGTPARTAMTLAPINYAVVFGVSRIDTANKGSNAFEDYYAGLMLDPVTAFTPANAADAHVHETTYPAGAVVAGEVIPEASTVWGYFPEFTSPELALSVSGDTSRTKTFTCAEANPGWVPPISAAEVCSYVAPNPSGSGCAASYVQKGRVNVYTTTTTIDPATGLPVTTTTAVLTPTCDTTVPNVAPEYPAFTVAVPTTSLNSPCTESCALGGTAYRILGGVTEIGQVCPY